MQYRPVTRSAWPTFGRDVPDAAWRPSAELLADSRLARFLAASVEPDLDALQARAAADPAWFWGQVPDDLGLHWQRPWRGVIDTSGGAPWTTWWAGGAFNWSVAATDPRAGRDPDGLALIWEGEDGAVVQLTNAELRDLVERAAGMLAGLGVRAGDRVGLLLPLLPETVIAVLALGRLGAIFTPIFSGYGAPAVASRLVDVGARLLITADGTSRRGAVVPLKQVAGDALALAPCVERLLVVRRLGARAGSIDWDPARDAWWHERMADPGTRPLTEPPDTDPETPYMVIHTSGTTGRPKGAVHVHGGFPIKGAQDMAHCFDVRPGDRIGWLTDLGWMMGPWLISGALLLGATLVLYEGAPDFPGPDRMWSMAARHGVTHLGVSPTLIRALKSHGPGPVRDHGLRELRVLGSTGEPWDAESWWWLFREVGGGRLPIINYSGGTEVSGGILSCNPMTPIRATSFGGPNIGVAADVVDAAGRPVRGQVGELVIRQPMPGMTRGFWGDRERYLESYWQRFPDTWVHGDWAVVDGDGYWYIHGRSDDTLKVAGKRVGPAEVEGAATSHRAVLSAAAIGVPHAVKGEVIVVFCVLERGASDDPDLRASVARHIAADMGKALKPELVVVVSDLPRTRSGKVMRRVIRAAWLGDEPGDLSALENPLAFEAIRVLRSEVG
jgi:acetyl-CoA synthetase